VERTCLLGTVLVDDVATTINHLMKLAGQCGVFYHAAGEGVGGRIEEPKGILLAPIESGLLPLLVNVRDPLHADNLELHDRAVGLVL
jgi:hypothetical protein